jgi:hypothetical protein
MMNVAAQSPAPTESDSTSFGDWLWPAFLGAVFAFLFSLTIALLVQLVVVPRVEARKRREERWERDVLTLGELLTAELPGLARTVRTHMWVTQSLSRDLPDVEDIDPERREALIREMEEDTRKSTAAFRAVADVRVEWLVGRLVKLDPENADLKRLAGLWRSFDLAVKFFIIWERRYENYDEDRFNNAWSRYERCLSDLTAAVIQLADLPHPPRRPTRMSRWARRVLISIDDRLTSLDTSLEDRLTSLDDRVVAAWRRVRSKVRRREPTSTGG